MKLEELQRRRRLGRQFQERFRGRMCLIGKEGYDGVITRLSAPVEKSFRPESNPYSCVDGWKRASDDYVLPRVKAAGKRGEMANKSFDLGSRGADCALLPLMRVPCCVPAWRGDWNLLRQRGSVQMLKLRRLPVVAQRTDTPCKHLIRRGGTASTGNLLKARPTLDPLRYRTVVPDDKKKMVIRRSRTNVYTPYRNASEYKYPQLEDNQQYRQKQKETSGDGRWCW